jgi:hypothetical protein
LGGVRGEFATEEAVYGRETCQGSGEQRMWDQELVTGGVFRRRGFIGSERGFGNVGKGRIFIGSNRRREI